MVTLYVILLALLGFLLSAYAPFARGIILLNLSAFIVFIVETAQYDASLGRPWAYLDPEAAVLIHSLTYSFAFGLVLGLLRKLVTQPH